MKAQPDSVRFEKGQTKNYSLSRSSALMKPFVSFMEESLAYMFKEGRKKKLNTRGNSSGKG